MFISGVDYESVNDGEGVRCVIYISGCRHNCVGCHNPETHDFNYGTELTDEIVEEIGREIDKRPYLSGITLSGGDPMHSAEEALGLLHRLHRPKHNVWLYTGFTYEQIVATAHITSSLFAKYMNILLWCIDVVVDGKFEINKRDTTLKFRGSSNQRIIDVPRSRIAGEVVLWDK